MLLHSKAITVYILMGMGCIGFSTRAFAQLTNSTATKKEVLLTLASGTYALPAGGMVMPQPQEIVLGHYYRLVQFNVLPTDEEKTALEAGGNMQLLGYLPVNAWLVSIKEGVMPAAAFAGLSVRAVVPVAPTWKLSSGLATQNYPSYALRGSNTVALRVQIYEDISNDWAKDIMQGIGIQIVKSITLPEFIEVVVPVGDEARLANLPWVQYVEVTSPLPALEGSIDVNNHRANAINNLVPGGRRYSGDGVSVVIGDDGFVGPHIDFTGRLTNVTTQNDGTHADHCTGIICGTGNLNPTVVGQAPGASIRTYSYYDDIYAMTGVTGIYNTLAVRVSSHSLGQTCNGGYTSDAYTTDRQVRQNPSLSYVHSSGNSGASNCGYGGGAGWGNITGGFKMGKNVITVGNLSNTDVLASSSSRGPAKDGRIKPDICAVGSSVTSTGDNNSYFVASGTSMACPAIAGVLAQLYHAYRQLNSGADPTVDLIKATVMNTAEDLGNPGPDFSFGYGRINALRAVEVLENTRFVTNTITTGGAQTVNIVVPSGVSQLRVMLYWTDYEAVANAATALVNDLDLTLTNPSAAVFLPWVLNPAPNAVTLAAAATRGADHLNNVEQVTLDAPAAGTYTANISGFSIPQGPQKYYLVYTWIDNTVKITHPIGSESFVPGETQVIRWDAQANATTYTVDYSADGGGSWNSIGTATAAAKSRSWVVPAIASGQVQVRVTRGAQTSTSANLSIVATPTNPRTIWTCLDRVNLAWDAVSGAISYEISKLGSKYMTPVDTVTDLSYEATGLSPSTVYWYSVRALGANSLAGQRAFAIPCTTTVSGCPYPLPLFAGIQSLPLLCPTVTHQLTDSSLGTPTSWAWSISPGPVLYTNGTSATSQNPQVQFLSTGAHTVALTVTNLQGNSSTSKVVTVADVVNITPAQPFTNPNFSGTFPPLGWRVKSSNATYKWTKSPTITGPDGSLGQFAMFDNYNYSNSGAKDALVLPRFNLSDVMAPQLKFSVAYAPYNASSTDSLRIELSTGCSNVFTKSTFQKGGLALGTIGGYNTSATWAPTAANQWREEILDLSALMVEAGEWSDIQFVNINDYGQRMYLGSVQLEGQSTLPLTLVRFAAERRPKKQVTLSWTTSQEENTDYFGVERSTDGIRWITIGKVSASGTSLHQKSYTKTDPQPLPTVSYYRLRMTDRDGKFSYSEKQVVPALGGIADNLTLWPVPTLDILHVSDVVAMTSLEIIDVTGKVHTQLVAGSSQYLWEADISSVPMGYYTLRVTYADGHQGCKTFVK